MTPVLEVVRQEVAGVVAAQPPGGLGEIVGAEREELGLAGELVGGERGPGQLDHVPSRNGTVIWRSRNTSSATCRTISACFRNSTTLAVQRDHHLGHDPALPRRHGARRLEDGAHLHRGDLGIDDAEPAAAEAEHRVHLVQPVDHRLERLDRRP